MGSYAGGHNARGPHTNRSKNNPEEPKQKRRLGTASNEITGEITEITSLYMIVDNPLHTAITLNQDLTTISTWADKWLVKFNTQKTESLLIYRKINKPIHQPIVMNNDQ